MIFQDMRACDLIGRFYILEELASFIFMVETQCGRVHSIVPQKIKILEFPAVGIPNFLQDHVLF
jgi:hypothetical protein